MSRQRYFTKAYICNSYYSQNNLHPGEVTYHDTYSLLLIDAYVLLEPYTAILGYTQSCAITIEISVNIKVRYSKIFEKYFTLLRNLNSEILYSLRGADFRLALEYNHHQNSSAFPTLADPSLLIPMGAHRRYRLI